jgi:hypothetical protein
MFVDKKTILQCEENASMQIQNQEEDDDKEVMQELIQEVEKRKKTNEKK